MQFLGNIPVNQKVVITEENAQKLFKIIQTNDIGGLRLMLNQAADPNTTDQSGKTALMMAIELEYVQWVELLMEHGPISINKTT
ncbi:MAG: ankyrin repeat domain-containing protein [Candidatus Poribacteria bacterium]|nr:ankyrin repeat domain-containing protein [Candidatus Poribacteria bacterium]